MFVLELLFKIDVDGTSSCSFSALWVEEMNDSLEGGTLAKFRPLVCARHSHQSF